MIDFEKADKDNSLVIYEGEVYKLTQLRDENKTVILFAGDGSHKVLTADEQKEAVELVNKDGDVKSLVEVVSDKIADAVIDLMDAIDGSPEPSPSAVGSTEVTDGVLPTPIKDPVEFLKQDCVYILHFPYDIGEEPHILAFKTKFEPDDNMDTQAFMEASADMMMNHANLLRYGRAYRTEQEAVKVLALILGKTGELKYERVNLNKDK